MFCLSPVLSSPACPRATGWSAILPTAKRSCSRSWRNLVVFSATDAACAFSLLLAVCVACRIGVGRRQRRAEDFTPQTVSASRAAVITKREEAEEEGEDSEEEANKHTEKNNNEISEKIKTTKKRKRHSKKQGHWFEAARQTGRPCAVVKSRRSVAAPLTSCHPQRAHAPQGHSGGDRTPVAAAAARWGGAGRLA